MIMPKKGGSAPATLASVEQEEDRGYFAIARQGLGVVHTPAHITLLQALSPLVNTSGGLLLALQRRDAGIRRHDCSLLFNWPFTQEFFIPFHLSGTIKRSASHLFIYLPCLQNTYLSHLPFSISQNKKNLFHSLFEFLHFTSNKNQLNKILANQELPWLRIRILKNFAK